MQNSPFEAPVDNHRRTRSSSSSSTTPQPLTHPRNVASYPVAVGRSLPESGPSGGARADERRKKGERGEERRGGGIGKKGFVRSQSDVDLFSSVAVPLAE